MTKKIAFLSIILLTTLLFSACFRVRTPEPPDNLGTSWNPPTSPDLLLSNFVMALEGANAQNYSRCFSEQSFHFSPTPSWYNGHESIWLNWGINDEKTYLNNIKTDLRNGAVIQLNWEQALFQNLTADSVNYTATYHLDVPHKDSSLTNIFHGRITFKMKLNPAGNVWEITEWRDLEINPDSAWSRLKWEYIQ